MYIDCRHTYFVTLSFEWADSMRISYGHIVDHFSMRSRAVNKVTNVHCLQEAAHLISNSVELVAQADDQLLNLLAYSLTGTLSCMISASNCLSCLNFGHKLARPVVLVFYSRAALESRIRSEVALMIHVQKNHTKHSSFSNWS
jgi:hypothetical protein